MQKLKHLFQPLRIGTMALKNRIVMPAMGVGFGFDEEGCVTPQLTEFLVDRARSGPAMIVASGGAVDELGSPDPKILRPLRLWEDKVIPSLERMVRAVHGYDVKIGIQIGHMGLQGVREVVVGPSAIPGLSGISNVAREMSRDEIKACVKSFGRVAERCVTAGFDFVEIHGAHGYLISEFLTPFYNRRVDEYGGSFDNRIRFLLEVVDEVRMRVGNDFPIGVRINGDDFIKEEGWTLTDLCGLAPILERRSVNYLSISGGVYASMHLIIPSMYVDQGAFVYHSEKVKKHVSIPVVIRGRIKNPIMADEIIREGRADLVAMGRAQIADPEMVKKAREAQIADIRPCLAECRGCSGALFRSGEASCCVNPRVGREYLIKDVKGEERTTARKVLVAGAGCAGLEAARCAAVAGHRVILCESRGWIGGQLRLAAKMPNRQEMGDIIPWYERQLNKLGVEVRLNMPVDDNLLTQIAPDVLVIASGSLPEASLGYIKGLENIKDIELITADELVEEQLLTGDSVLIVGGDQIGLQVADYLSEKGRKVCVVERGAQFAGKMAFEDSFYLVEKTIGKGVTGHTMVQSIEILPNDEIWIVNGNGRERLPKIDTIVLASDRRSNTFLAEVAEKRGIETHIIGDASGVTGEDQGTIFSAIASGYDVGRQI